MSFRFLVFVILYKSQFCWGSTDLNKPPYIKLSNMVYKDEVFFLVIVVHSGQGIRDQYLTSWGQFMFKSLYFYNVKYNTVLTLSWRMSLSYTNQSIDLQSKSMGWFLYDRDLRHESVKFFESMFSHGTIILWYSFMA